MLDTYIVEWYYINRSATDRRLALDLAIYKSDRQSLQARAVIFVPIYCFRELPIYEKTVDNFEKVIYDYSDGK